MIKFPLLTLLLLLPLLQAETLTERARALLAEHPDSRETVIFCELS